MAKGFGGSANDLGVYFPGFSAKFVPYVDSAPLLGASDVQAAIDALKAGAGGSFANVAALKALNTTTLSGGDLAFVATFRATYRLNKAPSVAELAAADNVTLVTPTTGGGLWEQLPIASPYWGFQATWVIDPVGGNDEQSGIDNAHALKTIEEFGRRMRGQTLRQSAIVTVLGSVGTLDLTGLVVGPFSLQIFGTKTVKRADTFTARTARNKATNTPWSGTDAASWAVDFRELVHLTASNSFTWVLKDLGADVARFSDLTIPAAGPFNGNYGTDYLLLGNEAFTVETLPTITLGYIPDVPVSLTGLVGGNIEIVDFQINNPQNGWIPTASRTIGATILTRCRLQNALHLSNYLTLNNCMAVAVSVYTGARLDVGGGAFVNTLRANGGKVQIDGPAAGSVYFQARAPVFSTGAAVNVTSGIASFDSNTDGVLADTNSVVSVGNAAAVWGQGAGGVGIRVDSRAAVVFGSGVEIAAATIVGGGGDWRVGQLALAMNILRGDTGALLTANSTWANFAGAYGAGGFSSSAIHIQDGAAMFLARY